MGIFITYSPVGTICIMRFTIKLIFSLLICFIHLHVLSQTRYTVTGVIKDSLNN